MRRATIGFVIASTCLLVAAVGLAAAHAGLTGPTWSAPRVVDPARGGLSDIDCPTSTHCVAADSHGDVLTWAGASWQRSSSTLHNIISISCPTETFCVAVSYNGYAARFGGGAWHDPVRLFRNGAHATAVSCASTSFCAATSDRGRVRLRTGGGWSASDPVTSGGVHERAMSAA